MLLGTGEPACCLEAWAGDGKITFYKLLCLRHIAVTGARFFHSHGLLTDAWMCAAAVIL
jgi:hypothetical protein